ncbi:MAG: hypothetical protein ABSF24_10170 [Candidatus Bathyarchaeia archaeon]|jgi:hypothetical protein
MVAENEKKGERVELNELQSRNTEHNQPPPTEMVAVFAIIKIKVRRIPELDTNFVGFRAYWQEEIRRVLAIVGDVKVVNVIT